MSDARIEALRMEGLGSGLASSPAVDGTVECRELPQWGPGGAPAANDFGPKERRWWHSKYHILATWFSSHFFCVSAL